jgi:mono/diheme cytochrome c family protein
MKKIIILMLIIPPLLVAALFGFVLYEGPRMKVQHNIRDFQMSLPNIPAGTQPVHPPDRLSSAAQAAQIKNPLPANAGNLARAQVYYTYYCVFCHGDQGAGDGPVGQSYIPRPADLRVGKIAASRDGDLLRAMLTGTGHEPVLERVVMPEHRWYLVLFVRSLAAAPAERKI